MRQRHVSTRESILRETCQECRERGRLDGLADVVAADPVALQPEAMDQRRARMLYGPTDDESLSRRHSITPSERRNANSGRSGRPRIAKKSPSIFSKSW